MTVVIIKIESQW